MLVAVETKAPAYCIALKPLYSVIIDESCLGLSVVALAALLLAGG